MKRIILVLALLVAIASPAFAYSWSSSTSNVNYKHQDDPIYGAKVDLPNLIKLTENLSIGAEGSKDLNQTDVNEGWAVFGKVTWTGRIIEFSKK